MFEEKYYKDVRWRERQRERAREGEKEREGERGREREGDVINGFGGKADLAQLVIYNWLGKKHINCGCVLERGKGRGRERSVCAQLTLMPGASNFLFED